jgi:hypothetical protein
MPRWASRITLEVQSVQAEHIQEISEEDARAEGIHEFKLPNGSVYGFDPKGTPGSLVRDTPRDGFFALWDKLNGKTHPVESNPWVWVISFKRVP